MTVSLVGTDYGCSGYQLSGGAKRNHHPVNLNTAKMPKRASRSNAALNIRMSCVLGCTNRHIQAQSVAISPMRKIKDTIPPNIDIL